MHLRESAAPVSGLAGQGGGIDGPSGDTTQIMPGYAVKASNGAARPLFPALFTKVGTKRKTKGRRGGRGKERNKERRYCVGVIKGTECGEEMLRFYHSHLRSF